MINMITVFYKVYVNIKGIISLVKLLQACTSLPATR